MGRVKRDLTIMSEMGDIRVGTSTKFYKSRGQREDDHSMQGCTFFSSGVDVGRSSFIRERKRRKKMKEYMAQNKNKIKNIFKRKK